MIIALVGATPKKNKWAYKIMKKLIEEGHELYLVNPKYERIEHMDCYKDLYHLPKKPDLVITVVRPSVTEKVVDQMIDIGLKHIWMQPGSESEKAIHKAKIYGIKVTLACMLVESEKND